MCLIFILAILGLCCCTRGLSGCSVRGQLSGYGAQASRDGGSLLWSTGVSWWLPAVEHGHLVVAAPCCGARASRGGCSLLWSTGISWWRLPVVEHGRLVVAAPCCGARALGHTGFSSCSWRAQELCFTAVASQPVASSQTCVWTCVPCISRQILNHWTTREAQLLSIWSIGIWF